MEFRALKVTCVLVSLACPTFSDVSIHAQRSEKPLVMRPCRRIEHGGSCAPHDVAGPLTAPAVAPPNTGPPIASAIIPPALAVPAIYADSPYLSDGALLARRAQANEVSAAAAFETAQTLASELSSAPQRGFSSGSSAAPWLCVSPSWRLNAVL